MSLLLDIFGFLSVILRGLVLTTQSLTLGGIAFVTLLALPVGQNLPKADLLRPSLKILSWSAALFALCELLMLGLQCSVLVGTLNISFAEAFDAHFAMVDSTIFGIALAVALLSATNKNPKRLIILLPLLGLLMLAAQVTVTHAIGRLHDRWLLVGADFLHMLGAAVWIGGLPYFIMALNRVDQAADWRVIGKRYSLMSMASVAFIVLSGSTMAWFFIGSWDAVYGTAYGVMTTTKILLLGFLLILGGMNYLTVEALRSNPNTSVLRMKRFAEVEIGIGITVLFAAASLTSLPPGEDLVHDRASLHEIVERITPQWPIRLESPDHASLAIPELQAKITAAEANRTIVPAAYIPGEGLPQPRKAEDIAWSEYNHHWAGIFVLMIGVLSLLEKMGLRLARNWPLVFLGLAGFLFVRSDPEVWPLGNVSFFDSLRDPEVVQHRVFVVLITLFGLFEWSVRTGRLKSDKAALLFPLISSVGGALLLTHSHAISNIKEQLLIEITHIPLALCSIIAGWARWLEIRLDGRLARIAGWIWPIAFIGVAIILIIYREA